MNVKNVESGERMKFLSHIAFSNTFTGRISLLPSQLYRPTWDPHLRSRQVPECVPSPRQPTTVILVKLDPGAILVLSFCASSSGSGRGLELHGVDSSSCGRVEVVEARCRSGHGCNAGWHSLVVGVGRLEGRCNWVVGNGVVGSNTEAS